MQLLSHLHDVAHALGAARHLRLRLHLLRSSPPQSTHNASCGQAQLTASSRSADYSIGNTVVNSQLKTP